MTAERSRAAVPPAKPDKNWPGVLALALISACFSVIPIINTFSKPDSNKDYTRWWWAASAVRSGEAVYPPGIDQVFIYPPASAVLFYTPLSFLGFPAMVVIVCLIAFASYLAAVALSVTYATGKPAGQHPLIYIVPVGITIGFVWDIFYLGQPNLMLLAIMLFGFVLLDRSRPVAAGLLFAFAAVLKAFPITVLVYLLWRRRWKAAGAMVVATGIMLLVLPAPIRGLDRHLAETHTWLEHMLPSTSGKAIANQPGRAFKSGNQSLLSVVHRYTRDIEAAGPDSAPKGIRVNVTSITPEASFMVYAAIAGVIGVVYLIVMPVERWRTRRTSAMEYSILLLLMVLFSPKAGTYYYCWALPAFTVITAELLRAPPGSQRSWGLLSGLALSLLLTASAVTQAMNVYTPQALGVTMWGSLILVIMLLAMLGSEKFVLRTEGAVPS